MDLKKYRNIFVQESEQYLKELDDLLFQAEKDLGNRELWTDIHGKIHSIKGMARALSIDKITDLAHSMETWCKFFQKDVPATSASTQLIFEGIDMLRLLVARFGEMPSPEDKKRYEQLLSQFSRGAGEFVDSPMSSTPKSSKASKGVEELKNVRVSYTLIEELLGLSQEIMLMDKSLPPLTLESMSSGLKNWIDNYMTLLKGLHFRLAQLRLISIEDFADLFAKPVRDLARDHGKEVVFRVEQGSLQADITLLERLREPFIHIIRNSIVHGIEPPDEREKLGKERHGYIRIAASRDKGRLIISIGDDGSGIDRDAIVRYLKEKKSMSDQDIEEMSHEAFFNTVLNHDFSTALEETDMAGRGIGMKLVGQMIEYLGGTMNIWSEPSQGTEFTFRLPLSLSVISCLTFEIGGYRLSVPTSRVKSIEREERLSPGEKGVLHDLGDIFGTLDRPRDPNYVIKLSNVLNSSLATGDDEQWFVLMADNIIGNRPLMVVPTGELLAKAKVFSGIGVMENGDISMLLDVESIIPEYAAEEAKDK